jgi:hypothetical protein
MSNGGFLFAKDPGAKDQLDARFAEPDEIMARLEAASEAE